MSDAVLLAQALRVGVSLRDRTVVVALGGLGADLAPSGPGRDGSPALLELVEDLVLLREVGARLLILLDVGAPEYTLWLTRAMARQGCTAVTLSSERLFQAPPAVERQALDAASLAVAVRVEPAMLMQLSALGYVPIVQLPVVDASGDPLALELGTVARLVSAYTGGTLVVSWGARRAAEGSVVFPVPLTSLEVDPSAGARLLTTLFLEQASLLTPQKPPREPSLT